MDDNYKKLLASVSEVRRKQKAYFAMKRAGNVYAQKMLDESKAAEKSLDQLLDQLNKEEKNKTQPGLF
jgi:hypothetical protein